MSIMTYKQKIKYYKWDNKNTKELFSGVTDLYILPINPKGETA